jgi:AraC family transcriptional activator of tynA and feaB
MQIVFSTGKVHPRDRLTYWREEASKVYVAHEFSSSVGRSFWGTIRAGSLDVLSLSLFESEACTVERTQRCLRQDADDDLLVCMQTAGRKTVHQDGRNAVMAVNDMVLVDPRRPFSLSIETGHIAYSYGFSDLSHFTRRFKAQFGCLPSECRPQMK